MARNYLDQAAAMKFLGINQADFELLKINPSKVINGEPMYSQVVLNNRNDSPGKTIAQAARYLNLPAQDVRWLISQNYLSAKVRNKKLVINDQRLKDIDRLQCTMLLEHRRRAYRPYLSELMNNVELAEYLNEIFPQFQATHEVVKRLRDEQGVEYHYDFQNARPVIAGGGG